MNLSENPRWWGWQYKYTQCPSWLVLYLKWYCVRWSDTTCRYQKSNICQSEYMIHMIRGSHSCNCSASSLTSAAWFSVFCQTLAPDLVSVGWFSPVLASSPPERLLLLFPGGREELADCSGSAQLTLRCLQVHSTKSCWKEAEDEQKPAEESEEAADLCEWISPGLRSLHWLSVKNLF